MSGPRYSIIPADALRDTRITDVHLRILAIMGSHSDENGWLKLNQKRLAEQANRSRETVNRKISELFEWGYIRKRGRVGEDGRRLINFYQVVMDRAPEAETDTHVTGGSQGGACDATVTGYVTQLDHRVCDAAASQLNDPYLERPISSKEDDSSKPLSENDFRQSAAKAQRKAKSKSSPGKVKSELKRVLDDEHATAVIEHRRAIRKQLSVHAAKLLAKKFEAYGDPNAAADIMIGRGWQGFEAEWVGRPGAAQSYAGSYQRRLDSRPRSLTDAARDQLRDLEQAGGRYVEHTR